MFHKNFYTTLPFVCFFLGYIVTRHIIGPNTLRTPNVIGTSVADACEITTAKSLALKIRGHITTTQVVPGIILDQTPAPDSTIKAHQSLYIVVSQAPEVPQAPNLIGMKETEILANTHTNTVKTLPYHVPSNRPAGECIAQIPVAGNPVHDGRIVVYISQTKPKPVVWPDFTGISADDIRHILATHNVRTTFHHTTPQAPGHSCVDCVVVDQHPRPGSLVICNAHTPLAVEVYLREQY